MRFKKVEIDSPIVNIIPLADLHLGHPLTDLKFLKKTIDYIKDLDTAKVVLLGDVFEMAVIGSLGNVYKSMEPEKELDLAYELLEPIKDKILCSVGGNHERRLIKSGLDLGKVLADRLGIDYEMGYYALKLSLPHTSWFMILHHGVGASRTKGGKINSVVRVGDVVANADIVISGHLHDFIETVKSVYVFDKKHDKILEQTIRYITVPSFMQYGDYSEYYALSKNVRGFVEILIPDCSNRIKNKIALTVIKHWGDVF